MTKHFSEVICPFRGGFVLVHRPGGSPPREIWKDMRCVGPGCAQWREAVSESGAAREGTPRGSCTMGYGPGQTLDAGTEPQASHKTAEVAQCTG